MKITAQEEYGLRCLLQLAQQCDGSGSMSIAEIAAAEGLSQPYVAKLLALLRQEGIIESARGRSGGYRLALPPDQIHLGTLLHALGEPLFEEPGFCDRHAGTETNGVCVHRGDCSLRALWSTLEDWMRAALDHVTIADLIEGGTHLAVLLRKRLVEAVDGAAEPVRPLIQLRPMLRS
jgi:Rrf2 family protein